MTRGNSLDGISRVLLLACLTTACEPDLVVGTWSCPAGPRQPAVDGGLLEPVKDPVVLPWSTDFEQGFCDLYVAQGFCYSDPDASYAVVDTIARSGKQAMAFSVDTAAAMGNQARCVREGVLPEDAYYGAWYYVPEARDGIANWNLLHFRGGENLHHLWDVSLDRQDDGKLYLYAFSALGGPRLEQEEPRTTVPIGSWFHIEFRLRRAADTTGEVAIHQDGALLAERLGTITDDTTWGQWYVGNLAEDLTPATSTVYVDDISIRPAP